MAEPTPEELAAEGARLAEASARWDALPVPPALAAEARAKWDEAFGSLPLAAAPPVHDKGNGQAPVAPGPVAPGPVAPQAAPSTNWMNWGLDRAPNGAPLANLNNAVTVLTSAPALQGLVWFDEFLQRVLTGRGEAIATDSARHGDTTGPREWTDADDLNLALYMQRDVGLLRMVPEIVRQAVVVTAMQTRRNCVREFIEAEPWDQVPRVSQFFQDYFGAMDTEYAARAGANFWVSMAARIYAPGCKMDHMVVLEGAQDIGKSLALQVIGGEWFTEQHESVMGKGFYEVLQGKLLVEVGEMDAFSRAEVSKVKHVITCPSDRYRESYGRYAKDHPRQCVFVGTTNKNDWNRDETGARRFWPIACTGSVDVEPLTERRQQLFAEAAARYKAGETWWEMPVAETRAEQESRYVEDPWHDAIAEWAETRGRATTLAALTDAIHLKVGEIGRAEQMRAASCLRRLGWRSVVKFEGGTAFRVWERRRPDTQ